MRHQPAEESGNSETRAGEHRGPATASGMAKACDPSSGEHSERSGSEMGGGHIHIPDKESSS